MGIKKKVTLTVEVEMEIELADWAANPTADDINGVNTCGFDVTNSEDVYKEAGRLILLGYTECNNDVFGCFKEFWTKDLSNPPKTTSFNDLKELYVEDFKVEAVGVA